MKCPICGDEISANAKFCTSCGATLKSPTPVTYTPQQSKPKSKMRLRLLIGIPLLTVGLIWAISDGIKGANKAGTATPPTPTYNNTYADTAVAPTPTVVPAAMPLPIMASSPTPTPTSAPTPTPAPVKSIIGKWLYNGDKNAVFEFTATKYINSEGIEYTYKSTGNKTTLNDGNIFRYFDDYLVLENENVYISVDIGSKSKFNAKLTCEYYREGNYIIWLLEEFTDDGVYTRWLYDSENNTDKLIESSYKRNGAVIYYYADGVPAFSYYDKSAKRLYVNCVFIRDGVDPLLVPLDKTAAPVAAEAPKTVASALDITATDVQDKFYLFDLAAAGFGNGIVYALYFDEGGTVTFDTDVVVTGFDAAFTPTTTNITAGTSTLVKDINEQSVTLSDGNSVCFVSAPNAVNYAALVPDQSISALPASINLTK